jgi:aldehyde:ferredoxin oxidoreductase
VLAKRVFNLREGATAADDTLPRRLLETPLELGSGRTAALTEDRLRAMVGGYYVARGWDAQGCPSPSDLAGLRLDPVENHNAARSGLGSRDPAGVTLVN